MGRISELVIEIQVRFVRHLNTNAGEVLNSGYEVFAVEGFEFVLESRVERGLYGSVHLS